MSYVTVEVKIEHGHITAKEPEKLPELATGLLTIFSGANGTSDLPQNMRKKADLPLIRGDGKRITNPTSEELDASLWGD
jgi:hypothetical protein